MQTDQRFPETGAFVQMMQREQIDARAIDFFCTLYRRYRAGSTGKIPWSEIEEPRAGDIIGYEELDRTRQERLERDPSHVPVGGAHSQRQVDLSRPKRLEKTWRRPLEDTNRKRRAGAE